LTHTLAGHARLALPLMLVLAACSAGTSSPSSSSTPASSKAPGGSASGTSADLGSVCAQASSTEGQLVYWNNFANPDPIFKAFNAAYPGIKVESLTIRPDDEAQRVLTEAAAGKQITPDLIFGPQDVLEAVIERDLIKSDVDWKAFGVPADWVNDAGMVRLERTLGGLVYNPQTTKPEDLPNTWDEVIDPKWAGKVIVDPRGRPFDRLSPVWGEQKTLDWVTDFVKTVKPIVIEGGTPGMVAVAGGEAVFTTGGRSAETLEQQAKGTPLEIKYLDLVPTYDDQNAVMASARHPLAAQCFAGWIATDGAAVHQKTEFKSNETVPPNAPPGAQVIVIDTPDKAQAVADIGKKIGAIETGT
jgi:iron(III) transport system substrate-binding protein